MILDFFSLREQPFGVTPDPRFWFASETHREALASLLYGLESKRGFVALVAQPGMGKTTVLFNGLRRLGDKMRTVFLFQQLTTAEGLLRAVLADLDIDEIQGGLTQLQRKLNDVCAEQARLGKHIVLVIDEAQNLNASALECVRMLSNFETTREKLIQIVLSGQLQLAEKLAAEEMVQLRQRISILARLNPLTESETAAYVNHRLRAAGYSLAKGLFTPSAVAMIASESQGIPRNINNLCFNAMSVGFALQRRTIDCDIVREVIADLRLDLLTAKSWEISKQPTHEPACDVGQSEWKQFPGSQPQVRKVIDFLNEKEPRSDRETTPKLTKREVEMRRCSQSSDRNEVDPVQPAVRHSLGFHLFQSATGSLSASRKRFSLSSTYRTVGMSILMATALSALVMDFWKRDSAETAETSARHTASTSQVVSGTWLRAAPALAHPSRSPTVTVAVKPGEFLEGICTEHFASCPPNLLQKILSLNPEIDNPNYIVVGQLIRIPAADTISVASNQGDRSLRTRRNAP